MELIYIGDRFFQESKTMMSCIYHVDGSRSDWGKADIALEHGEVVRIRQATDKEMAHFSRKLDLMKQGFDEIDKG